MQRKTSGNRPVHTVYESVKIKFKLRQTGKITQTCELSHISLKNTIPLCYSKNNRETEVQLCDQILQTE